MLVLKLWLQQRLQLLLQLVELGFTQGWQHLHISVADMCVPAAQADMLYVGDSWLWILPLEYHAAASGTCANGDAACRIIYPASFEHPRAHCAAWKTACLHKTRLHSLQACMAGLCKTTKAAAQAGGGKINSHLPGIEAAAAVNHFPSTHRSFLVSILLNLQLAVAMAAQNHCVVVLDCQLCSCRALLPLIMLPTFGSRKGLQDYCHIILT